MNLQVLICCAYRPEELRTELGVREHPLIELMTRMSREKLYSVIELERLRFEHVERMIYEKIGIHVQPEFAQMLYRESEGNPLFIVEALNALLDDKKIDTEQLSTKELVAVRIPVGIKEIVERRVAELDDEARKVLMFGAVIGERFDFVIIQRVTGLDDNTLLDCLDKLMAAKLVVELPTSVGEWFGFYNKHIRTVVYEGLSKSRIRIMHRTVGEMLESLHKGKEDEVVYELAHHFIIGKVPAKIFLHGTSAGKKAVLAYALKEAIEYYQAALSALADIQTAIDTTQQVELLLNVADLSFTMGDLAKSMAYLQDALKLSAAAGNETSTAAAYLRMGTLCRAQPDYKLAIQNYMKAIALFEKFGDSRSAAVAQRGLSSVYFRLGDHEKAAEFAKKSLLLTSDGKSIAENAKNYVLAGNTYYAKGMYDGAIERYNRSLELYESLGDLHELARLHMYMTDTYRLKGEDEQSIQHSEISIQIANKIGYKRMIGYALLSAAVAHARKGEFEKVNRNIKTAGTIFKESEDVLGQALTTGTTGICNRIKGNIDDALGELASAADAVKNLKTPFWHGEFLLELGIAYQQRGDAENARRWLRNAKEIFAKLGNVERVKRCEETMGGGGREDLVAH